MTDRSNRGAFYVPRRELAETIAGRLSLDPLMGSPSGLMLAAPRRTGKSTFLRRDLLPVLKARGDHAVLVDLASDTLECTAVSFDVSGLTAAGAMDTRE